MIAIKPDPSVLTVIHAYTVAPENQRALAGQLVAAIETFGPSMPGHLSSNVHLSKDGTRVTSYSQWDAVASKELFENPAVLGPTLDAFKPYIELATGQDFMMYEVVFSRAYR
jgi:hypothetical protein